MAYATVKGVRHNVRVVQDLAANWSVEVYPAPRDGEIKRSEPFKNWPVPLCIKLNADTRADALVTGLELMKKSGKIDDYHVEESERPAPPPPPAAKAAPAPAAKPPAAPKPAAQKPVAPSAGAAPNPAAAPNPDGASKPPVVNAESAPKPPSAGGDGTPNPESAKPEAKAKAEP